MSFAEQVGADALAKGIRFNTQPCWRCEGNDDLVHRDFNAHGNLEEHTESCPECEGTGKIVPHWSSPSMQQWMASAALGAMNDCRHREAYDLAWEILDWTLAYLGRCMKQATEELQEKYGEEKSAEMMTDLIHKAFGEPQEDTGPLKGALSPEELEDLVG